MEPKREILIVGSSAHWAIEHSFRAAFAKRGVPSALFDLGREALAFTRLGAVGRKLHRFLPVEAWNEKANRRLFETILQTRPSLTLFFADTPVTPGLLAQLHSMGIKTAFYWPDPLVRLTERLTQCLPLFDLVYTYSDATRATFEKLGADKVVWLPFAGKASETLPDLSRAHRFPVTFVGGWRPEREELFLGLVGFGLQIWGPEWDRHCRNRELLRCWKGAGVYHEKFAEVVQQSKINLNFMDYGNHTAANMRFFEIPSFGGFQIASYCEEMAEDFRDKKEIVYFRTASELREKIVYYLRNEEERQKITVQSFVKINQAHTFEHRAQEILVTSGVTHAQSPARRRRAR